MQETRRFLPETPGDAALAHLASMIEPCAAAPARPTAPLWVDHLVQACQDCGAGFYFEEGGCFGFALALHEELSKIQPSAQIGGSQGFTHCVVLMGPLAFDHQGDLPLTSTHQYSPLDGMQGLYEAAAKAGHNQDEVDGDAAWAREVIAQAKSLCMGAHVDAKFPLVLPGSDAIAAHIDGTTPGGIDAEMARDMFFGAQAVLVKIPTAYVKANTLHANNHLPVRGRDARYKKLAVGTAPPVLLGEDGLLTDGHHRLRAAVARNDPWMLAYQVIDGDIDLGLHAQAAQEPACDLPTWPVCTPGQVSLAKEHLAAWVDAQEMTDCPACLALEGQCDVFARVFSEHLEQMGIPHGFAVLQRYTSFEDGRDDDENPFSHAVVTLSTPSGEAHLDAQGERAIDAFESAWIDEPGECTQFESRLFADRAALMNFLTTPIEGYGAPKSNLDNEEAKKSWTNCFKAIRAKQAVSARKAPPMQASAP